MTASDQDALFARRRAAAAPTRLPGNGPFTGVIKTLHSAFASDPLLAWLVKRGAAQDSARQALFEFVIPRVAGPHGWVFESEGAAAVWLPPGADGPDTSFLAQFLILPTMLRMTGFTGLGRMEALMTALDKNHPKEPHAYLQFLGVDPAYQGQGLGSAILAATLEQVDALKVPAYLENSNPKNTPLYRRHGFEVTGTLRVRSDAPELELMWRDAR